MSLDVYLTEINQQVQRGSGIFIREAGSVREISRDEWNEKFPGREPVTVGDSDESDNCVFQRNITHNLNKMADAAGIYEALWTPDVIGINKANQLIEPLRNGLALLKSDPARFMEFNPSNGWGTYEGLIDFVTSYLAACEEYPNAEVYASR